MDMAFVLFALAGLVGVGSLVCFILVLVNMFQHDQSGLAIACIVMTFCPGIGPLIAFVVGWINAKDWGIQNIMLIWTGCWVGSVVLYLAGIAAGAAALATV
jgi:biotin transporter BioY